MDNEIICLGACVPGGQTSIRRREGVRQVVQARPMPVCCGVSMRITSTEPGHRDVKCRICGRCAKGPGSNTDSVFPV